MPRPVQEQGCGKPARPGAGDGNVEWFRQSLRPRLPEDELDHHLRTNFNHTARGNVEVLGCIGRIPRQGDEDPI